jgi:two-component system response regulator GlrR
MEPCSVRIVDCVGGSAVGKELFEILSGGKWCHVSLMDGPVERSLDVRESDSLSVFVHQDVGALDAMIRALRSTPIKSPLAFVNLFRYPYPCLELLKAGFDDFLTYPFSSEEVLSCVSSLWARRDRLRSNGLDGVRRNQYADVMLRDLIGISRAFEHIIQEIRILANSDATVLITGETGTGKDMCARAIHCASARADKPFIPVNCGGVPDELFESEFFGHERGAYTDAREARPGIVREAEGGTVFLDDIETLSNKQQIKLLRFLQDGSYSPLGSGRIWKANVRILAATNAPLLDRRKEGSFRSDLYYRLAVLQLAVPPLDERRQDVAYLAEYFADKYCREYGKPRMTMHHSALLLLTSLPWPGNVRELENVVHRAILHADAGQIDLKNIFPRADGCSSDLSNLPPPAPFREIKKHVLDDFELKYLQNILAECNGNISEAARKAGKNRRAFWELLRRHHLTKTDGGSDHK